MHLWTRDRHLCDGLSHRHRWTCARHGIAVDESKLIIVVQLQLCAVARHAAKLPVPVWKSTSRHRAATGRTSRRCRDFHTGPCNRHKCGRARSTGRGGPIDMCRRGPGVVPAPRATPGPASGAVRATRRAWPTPSRRAAGRSWSRGPSSASARVVSFSTARGRRRRRQRFSAQVRPSCRLLSGCGAGRLP